MKLVIVESPKKARDITGFFPRSDGWEIKASFGHVRDLPADEMAVDVDNGFKPKYELAGDAKKKAGTKALVELAKKADEVWLCTDPDREGEAIAWHLSKVLKVPKEKLRRATWTVVSKEMVAKALETSRDIDLDLVNAQQARRVMDRLVGYSLSPYLGIVLPQYRGKGSLSAGRVQSALLKVIVDREREILSFVPEEYWAIAADLGKEDGSGSFRARLAFLREGDEMAKLSVEDGETAERIRAALDGGGYRVSSVATKPGQRKPPAPFSGSAMSSEAARKLGFKPKHTMELAQNLFDGFQIDGEQQGLITYHRTDSVNLSDEAIADLRAYIAKQHGPEFLPDTPNVFKTKVKNAQEAHEAIRPHDLTLTPEKVAQYLNEDQKALYDLIWKRTIACQMRPAEVDRTEVLVDNGPYVLKATGSVITFKGFLEVYEETVDEDKKAEEDDDSAILPPLAENEDLKQLALLCDKKATTPPGRYTSSQLLDLAAAKGIYRDSTFSNILELIEKREYVEIKGKRYYPTEKGVTVIDTLEAGFPDILDINYTARGLADLDDVSAGERKWVDVVAEFYGPFAATLKERRQEALAAQADPDNPACPECGGVTRKAYRKDSKGNRTEEFFFSCVRYPDCRGSLNADGTSGRPAVEQVALEGRVCPECGGKLLKREGKAKATGKAYLFYGCENFRDEAIKCGYTFDPKGATGIPCPKCGKGELVERKKKDGKPFWACDRGREKCDGVAWDDPRPKAEEAPEPPGESPDGDDEDREF